MGPTLGSATIGQTARDDMTALFAAQAPADAQVVLPPTTKGLDKNKLSHMAQDFWPGVRRSRGRIATLCNRRDNAGPGQKDQPDELFICRKVPKAMVQEVVDAPTLLAITATGGVIREVLA